MVKGYTKRRFMAFDGGGGGLNASVTKSLGSVVSSLEPANVVDFVRK